MPEMLFCPYCGRTKALFKQADTQLDTLRRCIYCGEEVADSEELRDVVKEADRKAGLLTECNSFFNLLLDSEDVVLPAGLDVRLTDVYRKLP